MGIDCCLMWCEEWTELLWGFFREKEGEEPDPQDPWASREFLVKWKRWSYIHCSWDTRLTLSQLGGYKRVANYMKRMDERQVWSIPACIHLHSQVHTT